MDYSTQFVADRLNSQRAAALVRETELRRRIVDRGAALAPARPEVTHPEGVGVWLRRILRPARASFSH